AALDANAKLLASLGYHSVLERGYAVVRDDQGRTVTSHTGVSPDMALEIELRDGRVATTAGPGSPDGAGPGGDGERTRAARPGTVRASVRTGKSSGGGQGTLF
ncbi:MAG: exodeoxyribonuclease VII large subunit, partial [Hyphomicrobiaceae bacterium]